MPPPTDCAAIATRWLTITCRAIARRVRPAAIEDLTPAFFQALLDETQPDAILCKDDHYAALMGRHLLSTGLVIGKDILVAGFDDGPFAELLPVPLTTIRFPAEPFAARVRYERLSAQMADRTAPLSSMTLIDVELVVRASTASNSTVAATPALAAVG